MVTEAGEIKWYVSEAMVRRVVREELVHQLSVFPGSVVSYSVPGAAAATGYSSSVIHSLVRSFEIPAHYANSKPVILAEDLQKWVQSLPGDPR